MTIIVHRIRLLDGVAPDRFERWVRDVDYAACPELPSVLSFSVQRSLGPTVDEHAGTGTVSDAGTGAPAYFEIIEVSSLADFEHDMLSPPFRKLVSDFDQMAEVVSDTVGDRIGDGYRARIANAS
ncbi:RedY protein [Streptomyces paludis]|uniref:RedY protein n=1 Tax=Streptomyces paludis TaxID=2282738 RepID=A0A345HXI1_9ACTN|nr:RedY protein [Streptomyces paludis]AXG81405.1 RedY protein [Streptomyces paludis]